MNTREIWSTMLTLLFRFNFIPVGTELDYDEGTKKGIQSY